MKTRQPTDSGEFVQADIPGEIVFDVPLHQVPLRFAQFTGPVNFLLFAPKLDIRNISRAAVKPTVSAYTFENGLS